MNYIIPKTDYFIRFDQMLFGFTQYITTTVDFRQCANLSEGGVYLTKNNVIEGCLPFDGSDIITKVGSKWLYQCQGYSDPFLITIENVEINSNLCGGDPNVGRYKVAYVSDKPYPENCIVTGLTPQQDCWRNYDICAVDDIAECDFR
ncbi:MAG: hypothetical protein Q8Q33_01690 [Chlamydiota bacterium]|nr:hypothetical protein [Chlamydiota bacterium]